MVSGTNNKCGDWWHLLGYDVNLVSCVQGFGGHHQIRHASHGGVVCPVFLVRKHLHLPILTLMALFMVIFIGTLMKMMVVLFVSSLAMTYQMLISWCIYQGAQWWWINLGSVIARLKPLGEWDGQGGVVRRVWSVTKVSVQHWGAVQARPGTEVVVVPILKCSPRPAVEASFLEAFLGTSTSW